MTYHNNNRQKNLSHRLATMAVLIALALGLSVIERMIPMSFAVPGVKLGLANIVTLTALYLLSTRDALTVVATRVLLGTLILGSFSAFLFSASGAFLAYGAMTAIIVVFPKRFSTVGVSIVGAIAHNVGQLAMAAVVLQTAGVFGYLPVLLISAVATGIITGITVKLVVKHIHKSGALNGGKIKECRDGKHERVSGSD